jgi:peptidoglycan/LPS O-acetylase OafA/YrhL
MTFEKTATGSRIDWLDYARFLCAFSVVCYHYLCGGPALGFVPAGYGRTADLARFGHFGVDFFFMISGYVIMLSVGQRSASQFAAARFVRLFPAFFFCLSLTALTIAAAGGSHFHVSLPQWLANLTFFGKWLGQPYVDPSYWTLVPEILFYSLVFCAILAGLRHRLEALVFVWLALQIADHVTGAGFLVLGTIYPLFVVGCLLSFGSERGWTAPRIAALVLALTLSIDHEVRRAAAIFKTTPEDQILMVGGSLTLFVAAFVLLARLRPSLPQAARIGSITYPLYLLHQVIGLLAIQWLEPLVGKWVAVILTTAGAVAVALFVAEFVEKPLRPFARGIAERLVAPVAYFERVLAGQAPRWSRAT